MICWLHQEEGFCEGYFHSSFFRNDEKDHTFMVYTTSPGLMQYAEKCADAFNHLSESAINEICKRLISCAEKEADRGFELPARECPLDILNDCWFAALYADRADKEDEIAYVVEGEWIWGKEIGFVIRNDEVIYAGADFFGQEQET